MTLGILAAESKVTPSAARAFELRWTRFRLVLRTPRIAAPGDQRAQNTSMMALTRSPQRSLGVLRVALGIDPNAEAMKSATGVAVRNCPSSSWRLLGVSMAASFMFSGYQTQLGFTTEQTGVVFKIDGIVFREEPEAGGNLRAGEPLAQDALKFRGFGGHQMD